MAGFRFAFLLVLGVVLSSVAGRDEDVTEGGMNVKILGKSGKIAVKNPKGNSAVVLFDYIHELDTAGAVVGSKGKKKHSINSFAREEFQFTTSGLKTKYQNISARNIQFKANLTGPGAMLTVDILIFKAAGNVTTNTETIMVQKGTVKFDIFLSDWTFCGGSGGDDCKKGSSSEIGTQIELGIEIKGKKTPKTKLKKRGKGKLMKTLDIGGADCTLSGEVKKDGTWQEMATGYPKVETKGPKTLFKFRFPKFTTSVFYDPTLDMSEQSPTSGATLAKGQIALVVFSVLALILKTIV